MKSRVLQSWKIGSWKKLFVCGKKSVEKPEIIESEVFPSLDKYTQQKDKHKPYTRTNLELNPFNYSYVCYTKKKMKSRMLLLLKKLLLCGKKSLKKPTVELHAHEIIESEVLPTLRAMLELPHEIIESKVLPTLRAMLELPQEIIEEKLPRLHATVEIPHEIIESEILPRLPAESLHRFMRVCKQWKSLISTGEFIRKNLHYQKNKQTQTHRKLLEIDNLSKTFSTRFCDDLNNHESTTTRSIPFVHESQKVLLLASLDGLVFVELRNTGDQYELINIDDKYELINSSEYAFWNPLTGAYKRLSNSPNLYSSTSIFYFYFDSDKKDYKVLQVTDCYGAAYKAVIYSQRLNSRKTIQWLENHQRLSSSAWSTPISFGESLYFLVRHYNITHRYRYEYWIIVFDVKSEKFREIKSPPFNQKNAYKCGTLMVIKGCIYICVASDPSIMHADGELWRMNGEGGGWTKVEDFSCASNHPLMYDEIIDMEDVVNRSLQPWNTRCG